MANGTKEYKIVINGLTESVNAVDALNKQLDALEKRINKINTSKVSTGGGSTSSKSNTSALSQEEAVQKEINKLKQQGAQLDAKIAASQDEIFKRVDATKELYKETLADQKAIAAQERLTADAYSNTMVGMKQKLADIKSVLQTTDLGDGDKIQKLTKDANELTNKLKEMEEAYGQFGRNVGNYRNSIDGIRVVVAGTTKEYSSAREAMRSMREELISLTAAEKGQTEYAKQLRREYNKLKSAMEDATKQSKFLDEAMDTMQSFTGLQQISRGFSTFFGVDSSEMEKQIARLVALQNALQGLQTIQKQIDSEEGIGKWLAKGSSAIDVFVTKLTGAQKRMGVFVAETRAASVAVNMFSKALKLVGGIALSGGIILLTNAIGNLIDKFKKWYTGGIEAGDATKILESSVSALDAKTENLLKKNTDEYFKGAHDEAEAASNSIEVLSNKITGLILNLTKLDGIDLKIFDKFNSLSTMGLDNVEDARMKFLDIAREIEALEKKGKKSVLGETISGWFSGINGYKRELKELGGILVNDFLGRSSQAMRKAREDLYNLGYVSEKTTNEIRELKRELEENGATKGVLENIEKFCDDSGSYVAAINSIKGALNDLSNNISDIDVTKIEQLKIDAMADSEEKIRKQNELNRKREITDAKFNPEYTKLINEKYKRELDEKLKAYRKTKKQEADQLKKEARDVQNEINELELQLMREGLAKQMKALENERKEKLQAIVDSGNRVAERSGLTESVYDKKLLELKRDWAHEMEKIYEDMYANIESIEKDAFEREVSNAQQSISNRTATKQQNAWQGVINPENPNNLQGRRDYYQKMLEIDLEASRKEEQIRQEKLDKQLEYDKKEEERRHKAVADAKTTEMVLAEMTNIPNPSDADYSKIEKKLQDSLSNMKGELVDAYNEGKLDFKDFVNLIEKEQEAHNAKMNSLEKEYNVESTKNLNDGLEKKKAAYSKYYTELLAGIRTQQDDVSRLMSQQPVRDTAGWDIVNIKQTKRNYNLSEDAYKNIVKDIEAAKQKLKTDFKANNITAEDFFMKNAELDAMKKSVDDALKEITQKQKELIGDFMQSIQQYIQAGVQAFSNIMSAVWDAQDNNFDKQQEYLDKLNDELENKLNEQENIIQEHKDSINSIEDELATARGDRRQHLIDQLNAEMAAERAAAKEKKKIEKEQEQAQKKQDKLDQDRKKAQYQRDMLQAVVNGALAVTMAAVNAWPVPAVPMMALAAATTAAQIAIMAANKPYAKGGLLEGKSHAQGGIPIPGTGIEVEGKEYVVRKKSTAPNIDLLDYINKSERKLDLSDFIDFYTSGKVKKSINLTNPSKRFETGGSIPTLRTDIDINDKLLSVFEEYSNRPTVVQVVDIIDRTQAVKDVQVMAGLDV